MDIGELLQAVRLRAGLKQEAVATDIGVSRATIVAYENGRTSPSVKDLAAILKVCGTTVTEFFGGGAPPPDDQETYYKFVFLMNEPSEFKTGLKAVVKYCFEGAVNQGNARLAATAQRARPPGKKGRKRRDGRTRYRVVRR